MRSKDYSPTGGGALSSKNVSKLGSKEVSKKLRNFSLAIKKACHCEDERSEDVAIAKSLNINEITTQSMIARNDKYRHPELVSGSQMNERGRFNHNNKTLSRISKFTSFTKKFNPLPEVEGKCAFTLAEVLITLGIIGVVAVLTLPSVINKFQMKTFEVAFKKEYSVLNNTIDYLQLEESIDKCYMTIVNSPTETNPYNTAYASEGADCSALKQGLVNKLKLTQISKSDISYPKREQVLKDGGVVINDTYAYDAAQAYSSAFLLPDGAILMFAQNLYEKSAYNAYFILDVNGKKGPNKWGYDVFFLILSQKNGKLRLTDEYASISQKGGRLPRTILLNKDKNADTYSWADWLW